MFHGWKHLAENSSEENLKEHMDTGSSGRPKWAGPCGLGLRGSASSTAGWAVWLRPSHC